MLTSAMLVGAAVGVLLGVAATLLITASIRPDAVMALVLGVPTVMGMALILTAVQRWVTTVGAFLVALGPGWFSALVLIQVAHGV